MNKNPDNMPPIPPIPPTEPQPTHEHIEVIINERVYTNGDRVGKIRPHTHTKHLIGYQLHAAEAGGLVVNHVQINLCPVCKLAWFEELASTPISFILK